MRRQKTFDCIEMKRQGSARIYEAVKDLTPEEEEAYWREINERFLARQAKRRQALTKSR